MVEAGLVRLAAAAAVVVVWLKAWAWQDGEQLVAMVDHWKDKTGRAMRQKSPLPACVACPLPNMLPQAEHGGHRR